MLLQNRGEFVKLYSRLCRGGATSGELRGLSIWPLVIISSPGELTGLPGRGAVRELGTGATSLV